jgi:tetratricopeptide (TPR) repeat protein
MNRAERRKQKKPQGQKGGLPDSPELRDLFQQAFSFHQRGQLQEAKNLYEQILRISPHHADSLHLLGLIAYKSNNFSHARTLIDRAIHVNDRNPQYFFNLGLVHQALRQPDQAVRAYQQAIVLKPHYPEAYGNLGNVFREKGDLNQAAGAYQQAITLKPGEANGYNNLGVVLKEQGKLTEAVETYRHALAVNPQHTEAHCNLGIALQEQGELEEAVETLEYALRLNPHYGKAHHSLGLVWLWKGQMDLAFRSFRQSAECIQNHKRPVVISSVSRARLKHDAEQLQYLMAQNRLKAEHIPYLEAVQRLYHKAKTQSGTPLRIALETQEAASLDPSFNEIIHYADSAVLPQGALHSGLDVEDIETRYFARSPEVIFVDSLLTQEALQSLRQFCWESTIWKKEYDNGYVGAMLGEGFSSPLLLQISEELRLRFPKIFQDHRLAQAWAFKQDSQMKGLNIHADAAAVNVNFWITPNEANQDPESGGLVVWDKEAPKEWNFKDYNSSEFKPKIFKFLEEQGAQAIKVPYRENRALIFNSDLFHETDHCDFRDEYTSRRINITMLYGYRRTTFSS